VITQAASEWIQTLAESIYPGLYFHWPLMLLLLPLPLLWPLIPEQNSSSASEKPQGVDVPPSLAVALQSDRELRHRRRLPLSWLCVLAWLALIAVLAQPIRPGSATVTPISGRAISVSVWPAARPPSVMRSGYPCRCYDKTRRAPRQWCCCLTVPTMRVQSSRKQLPSCHGSSACAYTRSHSAA